MYNLPIIGSFINTLLFAVFDSETANKYIIGGGHMATDDPKKFTLLSLRESIPDYIGTLASDVLWSLYYVKDLCELSGTVSEFEGDLRKSAMHEKQLYSEKGYDCAPGRVSPLYECYNVLFGPLEDVPLYISRQGFDVLANYRLSHENKKDDPS
jgi:hypothetical protein